GHLSPHRRSVGQRALHRRARLRGRHIVGHVRRRRRLSDHAVADLLRHPANGRGGFRHHPDHRRQRVGRHGPHAPRRGRPEDGGGDDRRRTAGIVRRRRPVPRPAGERPDRCRDRLPLRADLGLDRRSDAEGRAGRARPAPRCCRGRKAAPQPLGRFAAAALALLQLGPVHFPAGAVRTWLRRRHPDVAARHRRRLYPRARDDLSARHGRARGDRHQPGDGARGQRRRDHGPRADHPVGRHRACRPAACRWRDRRAIWRLADLADQAGPAAACAGGDHPGRRSADGRRPRLEPGRDLLDRGAV
ncbi:MAG: Sulfite exporter TauE/SafE, partial [uncultured Sphingomonas sp.]